MLAFKLTRTRSNCEERQQKIRRMLSLDDTNVARYYQDTRLIKSFRCAETGRLFDGRFSRRIPAELHRAAARKLEMLDAAPSFQALLAPPSNRLEKPKGDRASEYSIRINRQWRVCFRWAGADAFDVEIVDFHS
jgi:proteic killer suppression protein